MKTKTVGGAVAPPCPSVLPPLPMYLWSPLFLAHFGHFLETYETHYLSPFMLERN